MRRGVLLLTMVCACNRAFGLEETKLVDAAYFDAPIDAPFQCPPLGSTPAFSPYVHQVVTSNCTDYTASEATGRALAYCLDTTTGYSIDESAIDADAMVPVPAFAATTTRIYDQPRIAPEGNEAYVRVLMATTAAVGHYVQTGPLAWTFDQDVTAIPLSRTESLGAVTRGPHRRIMVVRGDAKFHEYVSDDAGGWTEAPPFVPGDFGLAAADGARMTSDGLRMIFYADPPASDAAIYYTDRSETSAPFRAPVVLSGVPATRSVMITDDCSRVYLSGFGYVLYVRQL